VKDSGSVATAILDAHKEMVERMRSSKYGQEVERLENAYEALTGRNEVDFVFNRPDGLTVTTIEAKRGPREGSMRSRVEAILTSRPRLWSYDELGERLEADGVDIRDEDGKIKSSLRTAVWTLVNTERTARRGPDATVYATKYHEALQEMGELDTDIFSAFAKNDMEVEV
jgi:hypothetical protein